MKTNKLYIPTIFIYLFSSSLRRKYFYEDKSLDDVLDKCHRRVQLYLDERK